MPYQSKCVSDSPGIEDNVYWLVSYSSYIVVLGKFNDYLKVNGGVIGSVTCNRVTKPTDVHYITKDTPLINLVSFEDTNKNDWLYIVLMDVVSLLVSLCILVYIYWYLL